MPEEKRPIAEPVTMGLHLEEPDYWAVVDMVDLAIESQGIRITELQRTLERLEQGEAVEAWTATEVRGLIMHYKETQRRYHCARLSIQIQNSRYGRQRPEQPANAA